MDRGVHRLAGATLTVLMGCSADGISPPGQSANPDLAMAQAVMPGQVGRIAGASGSGGGNAMLAVGGAGVGAGHSVLIALMLTSTTGGAVSAGDSAGNTYGIDADFNDGGANDRTVILSSLGVKPLLSGGTITLTFPRSTGYHAVADEFTGVTMRDRSNSAAGAAATFNSGSVTTTMGPELLYGAVGVQTATSTPTWAAPWSALPLVSMGNDHLSSAWQIAAAAGTYSATGSVMTSIWMAGVSAYR